MPHHTVLQILRSLIRPQDVLQKRPKSPTLKYHTISYLRNTTRSFDYTLSVLRSLESQAYSEVARLGGNVMLEAILNKLKVEDSSSSGQQETMGVSVHVRANPA